MRTLLLTTFFFSGFFLSSHAQKLSAVQGGNQLTAHSTLDEAISQIPPNSTSNDPAAETLSTPSNIWPVSSHAATNSNTGEKRTILFLGGGYRPLKYDDLDVSFNYIDESPSQDNISTYFNLPGKSKIGTLHLGIEQAFPSKMVLRLSGEIYLNKVKGGGVDFGVGYLLGNVTGFHARPSLGLGMNYTSVKLGDIHQNDLYIQVNDTKFYSETVAVSVTNPSLALRPELALGIPLGGKAELRAGIGYHLNLASFGSDLKFSGQDQEDKSLSASKPLDAANANLTIDGVRLKTSFAKPQGVFLNLCIGWKL